MQRGSSSSPSPAKAIVAEAETKPASPQQQKPSPGDASDVSGYESESGCSNVSSKSGGRSASGSSYASYYSYSGSGSDSENEDAFDESHVTAPKSIADAREQAFESVLGRKLTKKLAPRRNDQTEAEQRFFDAYRTLDARPTQQAAAACTSALADMRAAFGANKDTLASDVDLWFLPEYMARADALVTLDFSAQLARAELYLFELDGVRRFLNEQANAQNMMMTIVQGGAVYKRLATQASDYISGHLASAERRLKAARAVIKSNPADAFARRTAERTEPLVERYKQLNARLVKTT